MFRKNSSIPYFVQRIPADVQPLARGLNLSIPVGDGYVSRRVTDKAVVVKVSLGTREPTEAKKRQGQISSYLEGVWQSLREDVKTLSHKQTVSLAGEVYKAFTSAFENNPGSPEMWREIKAVDALAKSGNYGVGALAIGEEARLKLSLEKRFGGFVDGVLARRGLRVDSGSRMRLLVQVTEAMGHAADTIERYGEGDYSADKTVDRYPEWTDSPASQKDKCSGSAAVKVSIMGMFEGWWNEASRGNGLSASTRESYLKAVRYFIDFIGHDDAARISPSDVVEFKNKRLNDVSPRTGKPISARTINDSELAGLKTVFKWGVKELKIPSNPAQGVSVSYSKPITTRPKGLTEDEAKAVLSLALNYKRGRQEAAKMAFAKRWVPWLCAYSGARVGEVAQLRKKDIILRDGVYTMEITPAAGSVKGRKYRVVPLHPHLVEQGFLEFVEGQSEGYLFLSVEEGEDWKKAWVTAKNRLAEFARKVVTDRMVKPNHGWRHRFITLARRHDMSQELRRMITGHKGEGVDETDYGDSEGLYREICKLPKYEV